MFFLKLLEKIKTFVIGKLERMDTLSILIIAFIWFFLAIIGIMHSIVEYPETIIYLILLLSMIRVKKNINNAYNK